MFYSFVGTFESLPTTWVTFYLYQQTDRAIICLPFSDVTDRKLWYLRSLVKLEMSICIYLKPSFKS